MVLWFMLADTQKNENKPFYKIFHIYTIYDKKKIFFFLNLLKYFMFVQYKNDKKNKMKNRTKKKKWIEAM